VKVKLELKENYRLILLFEYMPVVLPVAEYSALRRRMMDVKAAFQRIPLNLLSFYEINHLWQSGNGALLRKDSEIGTVKSLDFAGAMIEFPTSTWLKAEVDLNRNQEVISSLSNRVSNDPLSETWVVRDDVAVFPRMMVNTIRESGPRMGEQHVRARFDGYGPILAIDCVYGIQRRDIYQSIADATYIKKHQRDLPK
jgi:hypothetical protein